jgi:hypothetical protein
MKIENSRHIFEKYSNINAHANPASGSPVVPCGRTNINDEAINLLAPEIFFKF